MGAVKLNTDRLYSLQEYYEFQDEISNKGLKFDDEYIARVEYYDGEVWFMAGGTVSHSILTGNLMTEFGPRLKYSKCRPFDGNANLAIDEIKSIFHPDMFIACNGIEASNFDKNGITNASVIIEVLSKSTELYDRTGKFRKYKNIEGFKEYILVNQHKPLIETFVKHENQLWFMAEYEGLENDLHIQSLDIKIPLKDIYEGVEFTETEDE